MNAFHKAEHFRASDDGRALTRTTESTEPTQVMIETLMSHVRHQFYELYPPVRWHQEQKLILAILTWPATWSNQRGIFIPLPKYEEVLREIIVGIQRHGATAKIKHFPTYFSHTVKQWFIHNGEALYEERKGLRDALDMRFLRGLPAVPQAAAVDPTEKLLAVHRLLASAKKKAKPTRTDDSQPSLFDA